MWMYFEEYYVSTGTVLHQKVCSVIAVLTEGHTNIARVEQASTNMTTSNSSPLLRLPAELRIRIYEFVLINDHHESVAVRCQDSRAVSLLRVSCQVRDECLPVYYSKNKFHIANEHLQAWLRGLPKNHCSLLRNVHVYLHSKYPERKLDDVATLLRHHYSMLWLNMRPVGSDALRASGLQIYYLTIAELESDAWNEIERRLMQSPEQRWWIVR
jgi:hypothetical protein